MIYGIGTDLMRISRISDTLARHPTRFPRRLLHPEEFSQYQKSRRPHNFLTKSWAVKEAFGKALGTGVRGYNNPDIGVVRGELGRPVLVYSDAMRARMKRLCIARGHVSISDEDGLVIAHVILESAGPENSV